MFPCKHQSGRDSLEQQRTKREHSAIGNVERFEDTGNSEVIERE